MNRDERNKYLSKWMEGFASSEERHTRAVKFLSNNIERLVSMLIADADANAEDRLHQLRIDWYSQEGAE